jgi:hypothetical protein
MRVVVLSVLEYDSLDATKISSTCEMIMKVNGNVLPNFEDTRYGDLVISSEELDDADDMDEIVSDIKLVVDKGMLASGAEESLGKEDIEELVADYEDQYEECINTLKKLRSLALEDGYVTIALEGDDEHVYTIIDDDFIE